MNIPFVDLHSQHEEVRLEIETAIRDIIDCSSFIGGKYVAQFEREFAAYLGVKEAVAVANGTDALWLGLAAGRVKPGEAVITVPNTFIASVEAITRCGARPLFVDIDLQTANMDAEALRRFFEEACRREDDGRVVHLASGRRVAAILPVHLYGLPADMAPILEIADEHSLPVIEDACQAHGARYAMDGSWQRAGSLGRAAAFSFYPGKNLGAMGDGGAVVTGDPDLADWMRILRDHGSKEKYVHLTPDGWNSRLDAIQAAVLSAKLKRLDDWNERRRQAAATYRQVLAGLPLELPVEPANARHVYHLYVVRSQERERLRVELRTRGIGAGLHYPIPLHLQEAYRDLGYTEGSFPNAELSARTVLSLPMHPALRPDQIEQVGQACAEVLTKTRGNRRRRPDEGGGLAESGGQDTILPHGAAQRGWASTRGGRARCNLAPRRRPARLGFYPRRQGKMQSCPTKPPNVVGRLTRWGGGAQRGWAATR